MAQPNYVTYGQQVTAPNWNATSPFTPGYMGPAIGQQEGGADSLANSLSAYGAAMQGRAAPTLNAPTGADPTARANQLQGLQALQRASTGGAPSAAQIGMGTGLNSGLAAAYGAGRGGGGFGAVNAGNALSNANAGTIAQGGAGRANEIGSAMGALASGRNNMVTGDVSQQGQDQRVALTQAQLAQQQQQANNQGQTAYQQMANQTLLSQLQADTGYNIANMGDASQLSIQNINQQAALNQQMIGGATTMGAGGVTAALSQNYGSGSGGNAEQDDEGIE